MADVKRNKCEACAVRRKYGLAGNCDAHTVPACYHCGRVSVDLARSGHVWECVDLDECEVATAELPPSHDIGGEG